jgi:hypothetical protein
MADTSAMGAKGGVGKRSSSGKVAVIGDRRTSGGSSKVDNRRTSGVSSKGSNRRGSRASQSGSPGPKASDKGGFVASKRRLVSRQSSKAIRGGKAKDFWKLGEKDVRLIKKLRAKWLTIISVGSSASKWKYQHEILQQRRSRESEELADSFNHTELICATNRIAACWTKHMVQKVGGVVASIRDPLSPAALIFRMQIRTWRRRKAVVKLVYFLHRVVRLSGSVTRAIKRLFRRVLLAQQTMRTFIRCKHARLQLLGKRWTKCERNLYDARYSALLLRTIHLIRNLHDAR